MTIYARNKVGDFGIPGLGTIRAGETKAVPANVAAWLRTRPDEFELMFQEGDGYAFRNEEGRPAFLGYFGPVDPTFGYGGGGVSMLRALASVGVETQVTAQYNTGFEVVPTRDVPPDARKQLEHRTWIPRYELAHCLPDSYGNKWGALRRIAYTMWETDKIPDGTKPEHPFGDWAALINRHTSHLVVPCQDNAELFAECGVRVPITVIPYGLDTDVWPLIERPDREIFTVVQYGDLTMRKGPFEAYQAFQRAFPTEKDVRLVFKTQYGHLGVGPGLPHIPDPRVSAIDDTWSRGQLINLLGAADCFIWLSKGEGFGLPPLQAALTGLPVVMTTHTGMAEYYKKDLFYGVNTAGKSEATIYGSWRDPDIDHAAEQLRKVYENRKAAFRKGKQAAAYVRREFSLDVYGRRLMAFLDTLEG